VLKFKTVIENFEFRLTVMLKSVDIPQGGYDFLAIVV